MGRTRRPGMSGASVLWGPPWARGRAVCTELEGRGPRSWHGFVQEPLCRWRRDCIHKPLFGLLFCLNLGLGSEGDAVALCGLEELISFSVSTLRAGVISEAFV